MVVYAARGLLIVALLFGAAFAYQTVQLRSARDQIVKARAKEQAAALNAAAWKTAAESASKNFDRIVPGLRAELDAARKAGTPAVIASRFEGHGAAVAVPIQLAGPASDANPRPAAPAEPSTGGADSQVPPSAVDVTPHVLIEDAVTIDAAGGIYVARKVSARLTVGTSWASAWAPVTPDAGTTTVIDPRLKAAWQRSLEGPPWSLDVRALLTGPDWGGRLGLTWFPRGRLVGFTGDLGRSWDARTNVALGAAFRITGR